MRLSTLLTTKERMQGMLRHIQVIRVLLGSSQEQFKQRKLLHSKQLITISMTKVRLEGQPGKSRQNSSSWVLG